MPWLEKTPAKLRMEFVIAHDSREYSFSELCDLFGVSRQCGYKWLRRLENDGVAGLDDRCRAPKNCPHRLDEEVRELLLEARSKHPTWGRRSCCRGYDVGMKWIYRREVLRVRFSNAPASPTRPDAAGDSSIQTDDECSSAECVVGCRLQGSVPHALGRLSHLSVWWIKLGIRPELIEPAHPQQNGQHERMHRTLKRETTRPPAKELKAQQRKFDRWRVEFNSDRPHESLLMEPPATLYVRSLRPHPDTIEAPSYPKHFEVRSVSRNNGIRWNRHWINVSATLREEHVGCEEVDDGVWNVWFGPVLLGRFDERELKIYGVRNLQ